MENWRKLPEIRNDSLLFQDTATNPLPGTIVPCLLCTKPFLMRWYSGEPDQICPECWTAYRDCARVICVTCNVTVCRVIPKVLDNGYYIRPKAILHIDKCNTCQPGLKQSTVIEIETWERLQRKHKPTIIVPAGAKLSKKDMDGPVRILKEQ